MNEQFKPGTRVHIEFDAIVEAPNTYDFIKASERSLYENSDYGYGFLKVRDTSNHLYHYMWAGPDYDEPLITAVEPTDWEKHGGARIGDIWEADGNEYFAYQGFGGSLTLFPTDGTGSFDYGYSGGPRSFYLSSQQDEFVALNPRLVRRRGEDA